MNDQKTAIIIGAGPAGLTTALELLRHSDIKPIVLEASNDNGGISKTVNYKGNRIDIGGHRFFSKSDRVMDWWQEILTIEAPANGDDREIEITYQNKHKTISPKQELKAGRSPDDVMLVRQRVSRIFFGGKFYDYPISLSVNTLLNLGLVRTIKIGLSYIYASLFPIKNEKNLEEFFINRFGRELYATFFRDYTEKVWGVPCTQITAEWGAQRIKGLSITKAISHAFKSMLPKSRSIRQKEIETSLIEQFLYPKFGPGQMWDRVAEDIVHLGGEIHYQCEVNKLDCTDRAISSVGYTNTQTGENHDLAGDYCISSMPVRNLVAALHPPAPEATRSLSDGLVYRDFLTVGLLVKNLKISRKGSGSSDLIPDNWIYIQEPEVKLGRLQIFNNWSPAMVADPNTVWLGLEYFCNEHDPFWNSSDEEIYQQAVDELSSIQIIKKQDVLDHVIIKMPKAYPAYFGTYEELPAVSAYLDKIENLFLVGRNGMHKYNNQDHSMLTAMTAVQNIVNGISTKDNIWQINTEEEYHESK